MGIINFLAHRMLKKEAARTTKLVLEEYNALKTKSPSAKERDVLRQTFYDIWGISSEEDLKKFKEKTVQKINICCESLHGVCYLVALDGPAGRGLMVSRCLQLTCYIDMELEKRGFAKLAYNEKLKVLEPLELADLYKENGESY
ncbi:MAG: hypothetical protein Q8Q46_01700 [Candidatus Giovannonibacteria bacterium]|nr:hypothetical protein [Candidatus Giovannonibacteria bacterium]